MASLGRLIASARISARISKAELARRIGVSQSAIHGYESGRIKPTIDRLHKVAEATHKPVSFFMTDSDEMQPELVSDPSAVADVIRDLINLSKMKVKHPGVEELIADTDRCQRLNATPEQLEQLRQVIIPGHCIETVYQAEDMLRLIQNLEREGLLNKS